MKEKSTQSKKKYEKPQLKKLGKVSKLTLKTGSQTDFGTGKFNP
ncbi:MAG: lasso RiPP family leader peptide-containing protein [Spirosomaceae bacterium]|nr:lasso RiPP family leader peptide-containing protein [Spirosomataceae bacterium]